MDGRDGDREVQRGKGAQPGTTKSQPKIFVDNNNTILSRPISSLFLLC